MQIFVLVPGTYPESLRVIAQKLLEEIGFEVRFSGQPIENRTHNVITHRRWPSIGDNFG